MPRVETLDIRSNSLEIWDTSRTVDFIGDPFAALRHLRVADGFDPAAIHAEMIMKTFSRYLESLN